jgi:hypothetical protein
MAGADVGPVSMIRHGRGLPVSDALPRNALTKVREIELRHSLKSAVSVIQLLQTDDAGGLTRAAAGVVQALALAKEAGLDTDTAMKLVGWNSEG